MFNLNELSSDVARERHRDYVREADRERRMNELIPPAPRWPTFFARLQAAGRRARCRGWALAGGERRLRPACQD
ncbi:MAG TPA: hypothetical protein VFQ80_11050 [Thermomicrobiales bacterium]|nr:hypothetical protein [Thermomicrobiales bacterium]